MIRLAISVVDEYDEPDLTTALVDFQAVAITRGLAAAILRAAADELEKET